MRVKCEKLNLAGNLRLVGQELELADVDNALELQDNLLRIGAEFLRLPSLRVNSRIEQFGDGELWIFTAAVDDLVRIFNLVRLYRLHFQTFFQI